MITRVKDLFNDSSKDLKKLQKQVAQVNKLEAKYEKFTDDELKNMKNKFQEKLAGGKTLLDIQLDAFAVVREAAKRVIGLRHYDVQLIGGFVLNDGSIAQMNTGEGKTLVSTLPSYLHALEGKGVHVITANEYLARRDKELMGQIHEFLGLTVGLNISQMQPEEKMTAYQADITYGTGTEFGFDFLRDNMVSDLESKVQRGHYYAIVDEVDSILIDEAKTPLIIANKNSEGAELFYITADILSKFVKDEDYEVFNESKQAFLLDKGAAKIEAAFGIDNLYDADHQELLHHIMQSLRAQVLMRRDVDYIVKDGKIVIIDGFTGRMMEGRTFSDGLHQAIEAKEGLEISEENETQATITIQNYFRLYGTLAGMTGSATPSKTEFWETYHLKVITIPTNKEIQRIDMEDLVYQKAEDKVKKIVSEVQRLNKEGRPVLIGTTSIAQSEDLSEHLEKAGIKHQILNAKTEEDEAKVISMAGQKGQVMLATNMAGRGTDIMLGEGVRESGGLHIIGTERHESNRIDMQLRGRSGRQGDPGSTQFIISLEDDLFTYYDEEEKEKFEKKVKTDETGLVLSPDPVKYVKKVQETIENMFYSSRSHLLKLENVMDEQSKVVYSMRDRILTLSPEEMFEELLEYMERYVRFVIEGAYPEDASAWNPKGLLETLSVVFIHSEVTLEGIADLEPSETEEIMLAELDKLKKFVLSMKEDEILGGQLKQFMLQQIDYNWIQHLTIMNQIKDGIQLRSYSQEDPYILFEKEALHEFNGLMLNIESGITVSFMEFVKSQFEFEEVAADEEEGEFEDGTF
ncbi:accessory Sec system translocase SecA2 [Peribacillus deserti]|uniref:Protein translocase subunit SecA n=1 Tax=Peribacillus deserti TaxID=673318 RepID=A0A2N5M9K3_9BACI|nr:accessory Sec system translocase SecA2 [Peribacillus deserti]PLT31031.1 accessory Sec system translocase SecA2 [Peribacillus deserti]